MSHIWICPQCLVPCPAWSKRSVNVSFLSWLNNMQSVTGTELNHRLLDHPLPKPFPWVFGECFLEERYLSHSSRTDCGHGGGCGDTEEDSLSHVKLKTLTTYKSNWGRMTMTEASSLIFLSFLNVTPIQSIMVAWTCVEGRIWKCQTNVAWWPCLPWYGRGAGETSIIHWPSPFEVSGLLKKNPTPSFCLILGSKGKQLHG